MRTYRQFLLTEKTQELDIEGFVNFVKEELGLETIPTIKIINDANFSKRNHTFAQFNTVIDDIHVQVEDRHPLDVYRSVAHELVHYKQKCEGLELDGADGSDCENQANALAGSLLRKFSKYHVSNHGYFVDDLHEVNLIQTAYNGKMGITTNNKPFRPDKVLAKHKKNAKISRTSTGHHIYKTHETDGSVSYTAHNPSTNLVDIHLNGKEKIHPNGSSTLSIKGLSGRSGSTLKAHKFYSHLIKKHDVILKATQHTPGGMKTWQKLQKERGINVHGYSQGKATDIDTIGRDTTHSTNNDIVNRKGQVDREAASRSALSLIATRK